MPPAVLPSPSQEDEELEAEMGVVLESSTPKHPLERALQLLEKHDAASAAKLLENHIGAGTSRRRQLDAAAAAAPIGATEGDVQMQQDAALIIQEQGTGKVLMMAWMNADSLARTFETGRTWFWSRSRQEYWCKGETSGDRQYVREAWYDCDGDTLLFVVEQEGRGACHTGEYSCFFTRFGDGD